MYISKKNIQGFTFYPPQKEVSSSKLCMHLLIQIDGSTLFASLTPVPMWLSTPYDFPTEPSLGARLPMKLLFPSV